MDDSARFSVLAPHDRAQALARYPYRLADAEPLADEACLLHAARGADGVPHDVDRGTPAAEDPRDGPAPRGFSGAVEAAVLWVRNEIALPNIPHGERFAPLIVALFFFVLFCNLLGLIPNGASPTGNLAVTAALAILVFIVIEIGGLIKIGPKAYLQTNLPHVDGLPPAGAALMAVGMAPIEVIGKIVKPFALAVRLFGNMTAGHFVILSLFGIIFIFGKVEGLNWGVGLLTAALVTAIMVLELIVALLQAYVFALLSAVFIGLMQEEHH